MFEANHRGVEIPFTRMGAVSSEDLFEEREQPIFDFYERRAGRYRRALDIGANLGIHSILMARLGWEVIAFEPDPVHCEALRRNLVLNGVARRVTVRRKAVSTQYGEAEFVRVLGNTTANHIKGARECHGELETVRVLTVDCRPLFNWADFAKIDCEGHEAALLCAVTPGQKCEFMVEVGSRANAEAIFDHCQGRARMWAQHLGWREVRRLADMPTHYTRGSLFIGADPCA